MFDGSVELLEEYLDRVETLKSLNTEALTQKFGALGPRLYNCLRGEAYTAAKAADIDKATLAGDEGVDLLIGVLREALQSAAPTRIGEIFDAYFDGGVRRVGESIAAWLNRRNELKQQLTGADPATSISENVEAFFLLRLSNLSKSQRAQVLASCSNEYNPTKIAGAMRVQFSDLHKSEGRSSGRRWERPRERRTAMLAAAPPGLSEDEDDGDVEDDHDDDDNDSGRMSALEDSLAELQDRAAAGDEDAEAELTAASECLLAVQTAYIARRDLRALKEEVRSGRRGTGVDQEDRKKRLESAKRKTRCRVCGALGHWAGDAECSERGLPPRSPKGRFEKRDRGHKGRGRGRGSSSSSSWSGRQRQAVSHFAITDADDGGSCAYMAVADDPQGEKRPLHDWMELESSTSGAAAGSTALPTSGMPVVYYPDGGNSSGGGAAPNVLHLSQAISAPNELVPQYVTYDASGVAPNAPFRPEGQQQRGLAARCDQACELPGCPCEGFGACIGKENHLLMPHRCRPLRVGGDAAGPVAVPSGTASVPPTVVQPPGVSARSVGGSSSRAPTGWTMTVGGVRIDIEQNKPKSGGYVRGSLENDQKQDRQLDEQVWPVDDPRRCRKCPDGGRVVGFRNQYAVVWKCKCGVRVAEQWTRASKKYNNNVVERCMMAVREEQGEQEEIDDDELARLDTMCTSTMHGDQWFERYKAKLRTKYHLVPEEQKCNVRYRFGGGETKVATVRDVLPVGILGVNGEISSHRIPDSPTKLLLSLKTQKTLGAVIDTERGVIEFRTLGLSGIPLYKTRDGGLGVRITDFADGGHAPPTREPRVRKREITVYKATMETRQAGQHEVDEEQVETLGQRGIKEEADEKVCEAMTEQVCAMA